MPSWSNNANQAGSTTFPVLILCQPINTTSPIGECPSILAAVKWRCFFCSVDRYFRRPHFCQKTGRGAPMLYSLSLAIFIRTQDIRNPVLNPSGQDSSPELYWSTSVHAVSPSTC